ncbi:MFS transporter [Calidifontibacter sp. DB0510]|uniref:MFS transporter n=1 Tax=Metallococcus carri TaxID=1656884 RepID=A0A967AZQ2_9MICO|nr:MFS transporter [Metallococcus carri]NHN56099.1 MFS transporter [Metallococcus carri]NOP37444.1 MFS transporter [Calidifontibacter sp. DB2511S]
MTDLAQRSPAAGYRRGEPGYRQITLALFAAGMATFVAMYAAQAVLPELAREFRTGPATAALAVSATTGLLAFAIIPASALSERFGRVRTMAIAALTSAVLGLLVPLAHHLPLLLALRGLQGIALAGVPATAMAYLAEEVHRDDLGAAMGRYVAGTTIGGLSGRVLASFVLDHTSWRWALEAAALAALAFTGAFLAQAPRSVYFEANPVGVRVTTANVLDHLRNPRLLAIYCTAFLLMGGFVAVYNMLGFRLLAKPFALPQSVVGLVFLLYLAGTVSSGMAGRLADRVGRKRVLVVSEVVCLVGVLITLPANLVCVITGVLVFTAGFFGAHAVASGWVGSIAHRHRAEASALYLFAYYLGSSVLGATAGIAYSAAAWSGVVGYVATLVVLALLLAAVLPLLRRRHARRLT